MSFTFMFLGGNKQSSLILKHYHNMCACSKERPWSTRVGENHKSSLSVSPALNDAANILTAGFVCGNFEPLRDSNNPVMIPQPLCVPVGSRFPFCFPSITQFLVSTILIQAKLCKQMKNIGE
ncbi:hypothetical protein XENORESO_018869 [Xenotaenia resolanae]|uniref:Uncharacterized protein n=1 Tax=Xenotaenia resolanae TaxID=208358 RepID=A0ABV0X1A5_9TELE